MAAHKDPLSPKQTEAAGEAQTNRQDWLLRTSRRWKVHIDRVIWNYAHQYGLQSGSFGEYNTLKVGKGHQTIRSIILL